MWALSPSYETWAWPESAKVARHLLLDEAGVDQANFHGHSERLGCVMVSRGSAVVVPTLGLTAETAAELMTSNPVSLRDTATLAEAIALLTDKGLSAAPVIDAAGHPIGVLSRRDTLAPDRETGA